MTLTIPQVELYPHNRETYNKICDMWKITDKVAAIQATGTGKTYLQLQCLYDYNNAQKVVLAPSNYILDQLLAKSEGNLQNTQLMTYAKLSQMSLTEIEALKPVLIVLDEFHRCGADEWGKGVDKLLTAFPSSKVLGTSATPIRYLDGARNMADEIFEGNLAVNSNLTDAWAREILPRPKYVTALYTLNEIAESLQTKIESSSNDEESKKALTKELEILKRNLDMSSGVPQILRKHISGNGGKYIVFCKDKAHLKEMEPLVIDWFLDAGIAKRVDSYRISHGEVSNSEELMRFRKNTNYSNVRLLFSIEMLNEGIHVSDITGVILLRPTASPIIHFQQMGRAFSAGQTNEPLIFDLVNNVASIHSDDLRKEFQVSVEKEIIRRKAAGIKDLHIPEFNIIDETMDVLELFSALEEELQSYWEMMFERYKVSCADVGSKDIRAYSWIQGQRRRYKIGLLSKERIEKLESIGVEWDISHDAMWNQSYQKLIEYKNETGNCLVPHRKKYKNIFLGTWVTHQRTDFKKNNLSKEKIGKLNEIDFVWDFEKYKWELVFCELLKFKATFGHCNVPIRHESNGYNIGTWAKTQKDRFAKNKMDIDQIDKLNELGFVWDLLGQKWNDAYCELVKFKERNGHCIVFDSVKVNGINLGRWVGSQRQNFKKGKLSQDRIDKLNAIGFVWEVKPNGPL